MIAVIVAISLNTFNATASIHSVTAGPYEVSFDLGPDDYLVNVEGPVDSESLGGETKKEYDIKIMENDTQDLDNRPVAEITIAKFDNSAPIPDDIGLILESMLEEKYADNPKIYGFEAEPRIIDDRDGAIARFGSTDRDTPIYHAVYADSGDTLVEVISVFDWDKGTLRLLKSISVDR
jgi:hypothetical protein